MKAPRFHFAAAAALVSLGLVPFVTAQVQRDPPRTAPPPAQAPARDAAKVPATGSGVIRGVIVSDDNQAQPVRRALVSLAATGAVMRTLLTDDAGRFTFANLPAGRFTLSASKPAWLPGYYGSRRPGRGPGTTIALGDGQKVTADLRLQRGAVIAGRIVDHTGLPVAFARVSLLEFRVAGTEKVLGLARGMLNSAVYDTDDRGQYRIYGIPPGTYLVSAMVTAVNINQAARVTTAEEIRWALRAGSAGAAPPPAPPAGPTVAYAPVFYPGTSDGTAATPIVLGAGDERTGVDFPLAAVPMAKVDGSISRSDGQPIQLTQLALALTGLTYATGSDALPLRAVASPQGRFSFPSVKPGQYRLTARAPSQPPAARPPGGARGVPTPSLDLYAVAEVTVSGQDIDSLSLVLQPAPSISGRVVIDRAQPAPADLTQVALTLTPPVTTTTARSGFNEHRANAAADGTFRVAGLTPGRYRIMAGFPLGVGAGEGPPLVVKSMMMGGSDVADAFIDVRPESPLPELVITFTDRISEIAGTIFDAAGRRAPGYSVLVFPVDRTAWLPNTRRFQLPSRTATDGTFKITSLPAGDYFLAALTEIEELDLLDPSFLEQVAAAAIKITLKDGEKKTQDLKIR